jgi:hypothetical protein
MRALLQDTQEKDEQSFWQSRSHPFTFSTCISQHFHFSTTSYFDLRITPSIGESPIATHFTVETEVPIR